MNKVHALTNLKGFAWIPYFMAWPMGFRLPTIVTIMSILGYVLFFTGMSIPRVVNVLIAITFFASMLTVWIVMALSAESELNEQDAYLPMFVPSKKAAWIEVILGISVGSAYIWLVNHMSAPENWLMMTIAQERYLPVFLIVGLMLWGGVITVHLMFFLLRHHKTYLSLAKNLKINLFDLDACQLVALPLLRYLLLLVLVISLYAILSQFSGGQFKWFAAVVVLPLFSLLLLSFWLFIEPVWIVRARIRSLKEREIDLVHRALNGDRTLLKETHIASHADEFTAPDLIYYEDKIARIWEWPIRQNIQRIVIYILIPPLAWIMAALVERMVDTLF